MQRRAFIALIAFAASGWASLTGAPVPRWVDGEVMPHGTREIIEPRLFAAGYQRGVVMTADMVERVYPKTEWLTSQGHRHA